jgi:hypothetical protein
VDALVGRAAKKPVRFKHGCPGVAGTVTAASTAAAATSTTTGAQDRAAASGTAGDSDTSWVPIAIGVAVLAALVTAGTWWAKKRRT